MDTYQLKNEVEESASSSGTPTTVVVTHDGSDERVGLLLLAAGVGGLIAWMYLKGKGDPSPTPVPLPWEQQGFTGTYYGGPNGLGLITSFKGKTTSAELNAQKSVWAIELADERALYLVSELMHIWYIKEPFTYRTSDGKLEVRLLNQEEKENVLEKFSEQNTASSFAGYFNIADIAITFAPEDGYVHDPLPEREIVFPIPLSAGLNAGHLTDVGLSNYVQWQIRKAKVSCFEMVRKKKRWLFTTTEHTYCYKFKVTCPELGSWSYVCEGPKAVRVLDYLNAVRVDKGKGKRFYNFAQSRATPGVVNLDNTDTEYWSYLNQVIQFWCEEGGLLALGQVALETLFKGFEAQRYNAVAFSDGNWVNGAIDAVDIQTIFSTLMISPSPVVMYRSLDPDYARFSQFAYCWFASVRNGQSVGKWGVEMPSWVTPLVFPAVMGAFSDLFVGSAIDSTDGDSLSELIANARQQAALARLSGNATSLTLHAL